MISKAGQTSGVLEELEKERDNFLKTGNYIDMFPALYFGVGIEEFDHILRNDPDVRAEMLEMVVTFYDAYRTNRMAFEKGGPGAVESHWKAYYRKASDANRSGSRSTSTIISILLDGIDAHVIDLSRTIRHVLERHQDKKESIAKAYDQMDGLFEYASRRINLDIMTALKPSDTLNSLDKTFKVGSNYIVYARHSAWTKAIDGSHLIAGKKQPILIHGDRSRKFFDIIENGPDCP